VNKTVLITGSSAGIGREAAAYFSGKGWNVMATMRHPGADVEFEGLPNTLVARLDVQDPASIQAAIEAGVERFGGVDVLVNNAGFSLWGPFEAIPDEKVREQFEVNLFGAMATIRAIVPHFRSKRAGVILNVSSRAGIIGMPLISLYSASKFALEGFSEALSHELAPLGILVKVVAPGGGADTQFGKRMAAEAARIEAPQEYEGFIADMASINAAAAKQREGKGVSALEIAALLYEAASDGSSKFRYEIGQDIPPFLGAKRHMDTEAYMSFMRAQYTLRSSIESNPK
jgi:NAD(P)-dependent dehydrogenase (short-subunit alcohol dehydrogenase family)